jgi:5-methyltetrahydropteroyltriglutamate--homocysteine methyltransferase
MPSTTDPDLLTTVVGSYPVPAWLAACPSRPNLRDAILVVLRTQELAGIDVVSDGELSRFDVNHPETNGMIDYFVRGLEGVDARLSRSDREAFAAQAGMGFRAAAAGAVRSGIGEGTLDLGADWQAVRDLASRPLKFTVTSPYMLCKTLLDGHYRDRPALCMAIAEVLGEQVASIDAAVVQVDEANLPGTPEDGPLAAQAINRVLRDVRGRRAVHLCFGNYGGQSIQKGAYRDLLPFFNALECDHLVLECARRGAAELDALSDVKPSIDIGVGVIDIKDNAVETPDRIAQQIESARDRVGADRVKWVHPDCGFWMLHRSVADRKMRALVEGRNLFLGRNGSKST